MKDEELKNKDGFYSKYENQIQNRAFEKGHANEAVSD